MPARYTLPRRLILRGDQVAAQRCIPIGDALLGALVYRLTLGGLRQGIERRTLDGVQYTMQYAFGNATLTIDFPVPPPIAQEAFSNIWIPRGLVVYPATDDAPLGWGLPVVQTGSGDSALENIAPGLDVGRWTKGGTLGQVLLTKVMGAGYPSRPRALAPMYFSKFTAKPVRNLKFKYYDQYLDSFSGGWNAYRIELCPFLTTNDSLKRAIKLGIFKLTNDHRDAIGKKRVNFPFRGAYSPSQPYTDAMYTAGILGHYSDKFPVMMRTPADRVYKDGAQYQLAASDADDRNKSDMLGENAVGSAMGFSNVGSDPNGFPIEKQQGVGIPLTAQSAFDGWMASPPHKANIESDDWGTGAGFMDVGVTDNYAAQDFTKRDQWIEGGNGVWISENPEIPPLSWHSFHTMNLAWETWPVVYNDAPLYALAEGFPLVNSGDGSFWLKYIYSPNGDTYEYAAPALSSLIFMRGRAFAIAPHGGLVWAAAIQKITSNVSWTPTKYRLIALVHHESEQPADKLYNGMTSVLHVWYADLPEANGFAANPENIIRGVRGDVVGAGTWPWIDASDPWTWMDAGTIDMASAAEFDTVPCMLKYSSVWRFDAKGEHAVCMRDFVNLSNWNSGLNGGIGVVSGADALTVKLTIKAPLPSDYLSGNPAPPVITRDVYPMVDSAGVSTHYPSPTFGQWPPGGADWGMAAKAVDFAADGSLVYMYVGSFSASGISPAPTLQLAGTGSRSVKSPGELLNVVQMGGRFFSPSTQQAPFNFHVLSVIDAVLAVESRNSKLAWEYTEASVHNNPNYVACWADTTLNVHHVAVYKGGVKLDQRWYGNPGGVFLFLNDLCAVAELGHNASASLLPTSVSSAVQASYAKTRAGDWVLSYQVCPQPVLRVYVSGPVTTCVGGSCAPTLYDYANIDANLPPFNGTTNATRQIKNTDISPRGGWCVSSFADQAMLATMTKSQGNNLRFITARTV